MPDGHEKIGDLIRRGVLLFSAYVPIPVPSLLAGISAAVVTKVLSLHDQRVEEVLSRELTLSHVSHIQPDDEQIVLFYARNPLFPELESEFDAEIRGKNMQRLRALYPVLHSALVLQRQIPALLYRKELESRHYRSLALQYEELMHGYAAVQNDDELRVATRGYTRDLLEVFDEVYGVYRKESKDRRYEKAFEVVDFVREAILL